MSVLISIQYALALSERCEDNDKLDKDEDDEDEEDEESDEDEEMRDYEKKV